MKKALTAMFLLLAGSITLTTFTATKLFAYQDVDGFYRTSEDSVLNLEIQYPKGWIVKERGQNHLDISMDGTINQMVYIAKFKNQDTYQNVAEWKAADSDYLKDFEIGSINGKEALMNEDKTLILFLADHGNSHYFIRNGEGYIPQPIDQVTFLNMIHSIRFLES